MKRLLLAILTILLTLPVMSQKTRQEEIEESEKELAEATSDTARSRIHCTLAIKYRAFDIKKADEQCDIAMDLAIRAGNKYYISKAINSKAYNLIYQGQINKGILYAERALKILDVDTLVLQNNDVYDNLQLAKIYNSLGTGYDYKSEHGEAIKYFLKATSIFEIVGKPDGLAVTHNNLGISYLYMQDLETSSEHFQKSFDIYMQMKDTSSAYQVKMNIGVIESGRGDLDAALDIYREVWVEMEKVGNLRTMGHAITNIGDVYREREQYDSALYYLQIGLEIDMDLEDFEGLSVDYRVIGDVYQSTGNWQMARKNYNEALQIGFKIESIQTLQDSYNKLYSLEKEAGNFKSAMEYLELYTAYNDTITQENSDKSIGKIEAENEFNKQIAVREVENQEKLKTEEEKRKRQSVILYFSIGTIIVILFFVFFVIKSLRETRKQKDLVQEAKKEIELKNQEMVDSITYAKRIQSAILPQSKLVKEHLPDSFVLYKPKDIVAGDFYWLEPLKGKVVFAAADCTGHGVPGAMVSVVCNNGLNRAVREFGLSDPGQILDKTRELVVEEFEKSEDVVKDGMDIAICSLENRTLKYSGANNPLWIIRKGATEIEEIKADKQPIGQFDHPKPYRSHTVELEEGDTFYIFSDGYADQFGGDKGKKFKGSKFKELLLSVQNLPIAEQCTRIETEFENWKGSLEQLDDVCVIGVKV